MNDRTSRIEETIRRENCLWGPLLPGMKILV